jgi:ABC-type lipoprotein release transport system permease subunit
MLFTVAWKNIWRNKRRTLITAASIMFAVMFSVVMRGFQLGVWDHLVDGVLHSYSGYIQIHSKGYWDNRSFDYSMPENEITIKNFNGEKRITSVIPRLESFALASYGSRTKGVITVGSDAEAEKNFMALQNRMVSGSYITNNDSSILLSQGLAKYLKIDVGDSLVLMSMGYQGASATSIFRVKGIVKLPSPEFDNQLVFMPLQLAQNYYSAYGRITSLVVDIDDPKVMNAVVKAVKKTVGEEKYEVMSWKELMVELYQLYVSKDGGAMIVQMMLYLIVGFGVFGTVLMMVSERRHEFALMITLGMQRIRLAKYFCAELLMICLLGLLVGFIISLPIVIYFHIHPIAVTGNLAKSYASFGIEPMIPVSWRIDYIIQQVITVAVIVALALIYPVYTIFRLNLTKGMRR